MLVWYIFSYVFYFCSLLVAKVPVEKVKPAPLKKGMTYHRQ